MPFFLIAADVIQQKNKCGITNDWFPFIIPPVLITFYAKALRFYNLIIKYFSSVIALIGFHITVSTPLASALK